jgi:hypothetical protein
MFDFVRAQEDFLFLDPRPPYVTSAVPCLCFTAT